jgi:hypothetical protein
VVCFVFSEPPPRPSPNNETQGEVSGVEVHGTRGRGGVRPHRIFLEAVNYGVGVRDEGTTTLYREIKATTIYVYISWVITITVTDVTD